MRAEPPTGARARAAAWAVAGALAAAGAGAQSVAVPGPTPPVWVRVGQSPAGDEFFYEREKLVLTPADVTYWRRVQFATPQQMKTFSVRSALYREQLNCNDHTLRVFAQLFQTADGLSVEHTHFAVAEASPVVPDTVGDLFWRALCPLVQARRRDDEELRRLEERLDGRRRDLDRARAEQDRLRAEVEELDLTVRRLRAERPLAVDPALAAQPPASAPASPLAVPAAPAAPVRR